MVTEKEVPELAELTPLERSFVQWLPNCQWSAWDAMKKATPKKTMPGQASTIMKRPRVKAAITALHIYIDELSKAKGEGPWTWERSVADAEGQVEFANAEIRNLPEGIERRKWVQLRDQLTKRLDELHGYLTRNEIRRIEARIEIRELTGMRPDDLAELANKLEGLRAKMEQGRQVVFEEVES